MLDGEGGVAALLLVFTTVTASRRSWLGPGTIKFMDIKSRAHRFGEKIDLTKVGKDVVEENFGTKLRPPMSLMTRLLWILGVLCLIVGVEVVFLLRRAPKEVRAKAEVAKLQVHAAPKWQGPQPQQIAERFLAASTQEERMRWVREPAAVAALMERFYRDGPGGSEKMGSMKKVSESVSTQVGALQRFSVTMTNGSKRLLYVPFDESGGRVDFKCYAAYCSEPWDKLLDGTVVQTGEMRVYLELSDYYNYEFPDQDQWQCLLATAPELVDPIYLYVRRDSPAMKELEKCPFTEPTRYTIAMENQGKSYKRRQWQLTRVICNGWLVP
jgi:hypothetical protein